MEFSNYPQANRDQFFTEMLPEEEGYRPIPEGAGFEWTETSMFGFNIPEHGLDCIIYFWHRPVLKVTYGGIMIWRGKNTNQVECEYSDYRMAMPMPNDMTDCTYANGITVKMIKPLEEFALAFDDPARKTSLRLHLKAMMPALCRYNGGHITQAMKTSGALVLNGRKFAIDGYHSRDRSWNEHRKESILQIPPAPWYVGIIDESFAFHSLSFDSVKFHPEWRELFPHLSFEKNSLWGYVFEDGESHGIVAVEQQTEYDSSTTVPKAMQSVIHAANGKHYEISGKTISVTQIQCWPNVAGYFALMEWKCGKKVGYGDIQVVIPRDAYRQLTGKDREVW